MRVVVMGMTGCGKSTVGTLLADEVPAEFLDGDDLHSANAIPKMTAGLPLEDEGRWPWLDAVATWLTDRDRGIIACSALKRVYRDRIRDVAGDTVISVHLHAPQSVLEPRVRRRAAVEGHFAGEGLLDSQYECLEPLGPDEIGGTVATQNHSPEGATAVARSIIDSATDTAAR